MSASPTPSRASRAAEASPPTAPRIAAASTPRMPPELGTVTLLTFLMMLPEQPTSSDSGSHPSTSRASAAAYATAMGSVQPSAQISSEFNRSHSARSRCSGDMSATFLTSTAIPFRCVIQLPPSVAAPSALLTETRLGPQRPNRVVGGAYWTVVAPSRRSARSRWPRFPGNRSRG